MSENKATSGPWRVGNERLMIYGADDHLIARVYHNTQFKHARPCDSHLIAAAPDLLAALKRMVLTHGCSVGDDTICADCVDAKAAIRKSEAQP